MSDFAQHVAQASCQCTRCLLVDHGGISLEGEGWADVEFEVDMRGGRGD